MLTTVRFAAGPNIAWYNQMKDSCDGLNTRIWMDEMRGKLSGWHMPIHEVSTKDFRYPLHR